MASQTPPEPVVQTAIRIDSHLDGANERSLADIAMCCGFGGTSQLSRAFRARFGSPPRQYLGLVRQQDLEWQEARLIADGFDPNAFLWRQEGLR